MEIVVVLFFFFSKFALLYFGYRDDYRRDSKEFWTTAVGTPFVMLGFVILNSMIVGWVWFFYKLFEWLFC